MIRTRKYMHTKKERGGGVGAVAYAKGLKRVSQKQLSPKSGTAMVRTRATLARLMQVQKVSNAACPRLGAIVPSNLHHSNKNKLIR